MMSMPFRAPIDWRILRDAAELAVARYRLWIADYHRAVGAAIRAELHPEPAPAPRPRVIVPARVPVGEQLPSQCASFAELARGYGWAIKVRYAMAVDGEKMIETCVCRFQRDGRAGWAAWHRDNGGSWLFESAWVGTQRYGWQRGKNWPADRYTIREILAQ
jgi:hypothetical protein